MPIRPSFWHFALCRGLVLACVAAMHAPRIAEAGGPAPGVAIVDLSADPLQARGTGQLPTLTLALSLKTATVGAQFRDEYLPGKRYQGYFDSLQCYRYDKTAGLKHFRSSAPASTQGHGCAGQGFSGNFLNWATASTLDLLRLGLTGGDRVEDSTSSTLLQRAILPETFFESAGHFPLKTLSNAAARQALPAEFFKVGDTAPVRIANCLDRLHIHTSGSAPSKTGAQACADPGAVLGPLLQSEAGRGWPLGFAPCAAEGGQCTFRGTREILYGNETRWQRRLAKNGLPCASHAWGGDPAPGLAKACLIRETTEKFASEMIAGDDFFHVRVQACPPSSGLPPGLRPGGCQPYPDGGSKPEGALQRYGDRLRVAAFGYLLETGDQRYGAVLRAPMALAGPNARDVSGTLLPGLNPLRQWNPQTGELIGNPHASAEGVSGTISYLNTLGRHGAPGLYKDNDPAAELYYEGLRYLQGLPPTPQAIAGMDAARRNGFAAHGTWTDPFEGSTNAENHACLRNSILLIGDNSPHADRSIPGNTSTAHHDFSRTAEVGLARNVPDFKEWTRVVGGFESGDTIAYVDGRGQPQATGNPTASRDPALRNLHEQSAGFEGKSAYYLAGMAYWAHTHDIRGAGWSDAARRRPGLRATTYVLDIGQSSSGSPDPLTHRRTPLFLTAKYGGFRDLTGTGGPYLPPAADGRHWAAESDPAQARTFRQGSDADQLLQALEDIFATASRQGNPLALPALSGSALASEQGAVYLSSFDPERWSGDVVRSAVFLDANGALRQSDLLQAPSAARYLDQLTDEQTDARKIYIGGPGGRASAFTWSAIDAWLKDQLDRAHPQAPADGQGEPRLKFVRGHRALEGAPFRRRASRLGDIVHSGMAYSGAPDGRHAGSSYQNFLDRYRGRTKAVFVGANDGMLHAFDAETLAELFAYIPSWLGPRLSLLSHAGYNAGAHASYVDAPPAVGEAQLPGGWRTVLVSGTGGGGQGVFALDVTDPSTFDATKVLWEFTDADDPDLGNVLGQPHIVKLRVSPGARAGIPTHRWFAAVPGGVNNQVEDGPGRYSDSGKPALFLLGLDKPAGAPWSLGHNYFKVVLPISNDPALGTQDLDSSGQPTGRGAASGVIGLNYTADAAGAVEFFYFGDLQGQLWKLDMARAQLDVPDESGWSLATLSAYRKGAGQPLPMYVAATAEGKAQPVSAAPAIFHGPRGSYLVAFGTGKYLEPWDNGVHAATRKQSFYVLFDDPQAGPVADSKGRAAFDGRTRLQAGTVNLANGSITVPTFYWNTPRASDGKTRKAGWYLDLPRSGPQGGEQQVHAPLIFGGEVFFRTLLPPGPADGCKGGGGYLYAAHLATGLGSVVSAASAQGAPVLLRLGAERSGSDGSGMRRKVETAVVALPSGAGALGLSAPRTASSLVGRISWRQIADYRELRKRSWD